MAMFSATSLTVCTIAALCSGGPAPAPESAFDLTMRGTDGVERVVRLTCAPDAGTHPRARQACAALTEAEGNFDRLPTKQTACTMVHSPVRAHAEGNWRGSPVDYATEYSNRCLADARSGGVFAF
ncbi:SSI family serine proteinase inhibitor [Saccharomonospora saliphila]|uniref:SSI family serine proteinase inhibitor n=1 Tax=Saccharomonospora saliphila TaxID=369829 RepID=UPI00048EE0AE|nr:SSI family serine proteinase inhibitor [Saccharomonospora saliphila]